MFPFSNSGSWFGSKGRKKQRREAGKALTRRRRDEQLRYQLESLEVLEERTVLSVSFTTGSNSIAFTTDTGADDLYLKVANGILEYSTPGPSTYESTGLAIGAGTSVTYQGATGVEVVGTLFMAGMDQGGGIYSTSGPLEVNASLSTQGNPLNLSGGKITVDDAPLVSGFAGTLQTSQGSSFNITGGAPNTGRLTVAGPSDAGLHEGELVTFAGSVSGSLLPGTQYAVHLPDPSDQGTIQLFLPIAISTSSPSGTAGALALNAPTISVGSFDQLAAQGSNTSGNAPITLSATDSNAQVKSLFNSSANLLGASFASSISIGTGAFLSGSDVSLTSTSGNTKPATLAVGSTSGSGLLAGISGVEQRVADYLGQFGSVPVTVLVTSASATTKLGAYASITSSGSVTVSGSATANSTSDAISWSGTSPGAVSGSFALNEAFTDAEATIDAHATITAIAGVSITSTTKTTASGSSLVAQNAGSAPILPNDLGISGAYNNLATTSLATVAQGALISSPSGNVNVAATATNNNVVNVQTASYQDGRVGLAGARTNVNANVKAYVDGTIVAGGRLTGSQETINPFLSTSFAAGNGSFGASNQVDYENSRFVFMANPGYTTGEALSYSSGLGGPILGLTSGRVYYAIVSSDGTHTYVQLAQTAEDARAGRAIGFGQYPTIAGLPISDVDASNDQILFNFNPGFTEGQAVKFAPAAGQFLDYDNDQGEIVGPLSGTYRVHLVNSSVAGQYAIQLLGADGKAVALDASPTLTTNSGQVVRVVGFNTNADLLVLNPSDLAKVSLANGDALTYTSGLGTNVTGLTDGATYYAVVDPAAIASSPSGSPRTLQLAATRNDAEAADPTRQLPTLTWTDAQGNAQTTAIPRAMTSDGTGEGNALVFPGITSPIPDGTTVIYHSGGPGTTIGGLVDGAAYRVSVVPGSAGGVTLVHLIPAGQGANGKPVSLSLDETLRTSDGRTFLIVGSDAIQHTLTVVPQGNGPALVPGEPLTYTGALGASTGGLVDGRDYDVLLPNPSNPNLIQLADTNGNLLDFQKAVTLGTLDHSYMSGVAQSLTPVVSQGISITSTLTSRETLGVAAGIGGEPPIKYRLLDDLPTGSMPVSTSTSGDPVKETFASLAAQGMADASLRAFLAGLVDLLSVTGSFLVESVTNSSVAEVGSNAIPVSYTHLTLPTILRV